LFQIKICGITSAKDARFAALAGADAIGLNFYDQSARYLKPADAESLVPTIPKTVARVGVFVNADLAEINDAVEKLALDYVQLHGDEPPELLGNIAQGKVIRAFRFGDDGFTPIVSYLDACQSLGRIPDVILLDAHQPHEYGGTGKQIDWSAVTACREFVGDTPWVLAGGLTPFNVADAITVTDADAVDTASGVETSPGVKDPLLMRAFCTTAKKAFAGRDGAGKN